MKRTIFLALFVLCTTPALAQQQTDPQGIIATTIGQLVIQNAQLTSQRDIAQKQIEALQTRVKELEAKLPKPEENSDAEKVRSHP